ncbi:MAG TPA: SAVED domain-containing protein [Mycobacteriales bacterium]|nr:SAVED domain-containing protein [Mycobacteriales bacterium]
MTAPQPAPTPTGVRIAGDRYQWLLAWLECVVLLRDQQTGAPNPAVAVGVEVDDAGNVDDIVVYRFRPPHSYKQVKYAVDATSPVNTAFVTAPSQTGGPSILAKLVSAWQKLTADGDPVELALVTNRAPDPDDDLVSKRDARTRLLVPRGEGGGPGSKLGKARMAWANAAGVGDEELLQLLRVLEFDLARDRQHVENLAQLTMLLAGLRDDDQALSLATDWIAGQVVAGARTLTAEAIAAAVDELDLRAAAARTIVSIATLQQDPLAAQARHTLDWVDRFDGETSFDKRKPRPPSTWQELHDDIDALASACHGDRSIAITGTLRLAPAFAVGAALRMVTNTDVAVVQRGQLWTSDAAYDAPARPEVRETLISQGADLAVAVAVAADPTDEVVDYLREADIPVDRLVVLSFGNGPRDNLVQSPGHACALAIGIRDEVRRWARQHPRVHLFQAGPMGLALLLGHRWNRVAPTIVYEDLGHVGGYEPAFNIIA